jgi:hypothetical protein
VALIGKIAIAMAVDTKRLGSGLKGAAGQLTAFQGRIEQTGGALKALLAGAAAYKAAEGIRSMVMTASDLNENMSKTQAIFGAGAKTVVAAADQMAAAFGTSKNEFLDASGKMGGLFKGAGFSADEAAKLSVQFTKLSADASSFFNLRFDEAFTKIRSGLSGESEPLKDLGILMNEDMVKAQALAMGLAKGGQELSNQAKVQARAAIIMRGLADANGDLARTADGVANATRGLAGRIENLAGMVGTVLQPAVQSALAQMSTSILALSLYWEDNANAVAAWGETTVVATSRATDSAGWLQKGVGYIANAYQVLKLGGMAAMVGLFKMSSSFYWLLGKISEAADMIAKQFGYSTSSATEFFASAGAQAEAMASSMWEELGRAANEPWKSEAVDRYFSNAQAKIAAVRKAAMGQGPAAIAATTGGPAEKKPGKVEFASSMTAGSKEAANAVLRSRYGSSTAGKGAQEQTAKNTARTNELLGKLVSAAGQNAGASAGAAVGRMLFGGNF